MTSKVIARRSQKQRTETTVAKLVAAARAQFGDGGYEAASLDEISAAAGVTKGALYHHFPKGKPELLEAVVTEIQERIVAAMTDAAGNTRGRDAVRAAIDAYFEIALERRVYRITLQDAPAVFGLKRWRDIEYAYTLKFIRDGLDTAPGAALAPAAKDMLASAIFGACCEATVAIAMSKDQTAARAQAIEIITTMLSSVSGPRTHR